MLGWDRSGIGYSVSTDTAGIGSVLLSGKSASIPGPILHMRHVCVMKTVVLCFDCTHQRKKQHSSALKCHANQNALHHMPTQISVSVIYCCRQITPSIGIGTRYWYRSRPKVSVSEVSVNCGIGLTLLHADSVQSSDISAQVLLSPLRYSRC